MEPVKQICDDCINRFSCMFDCNTVRTSCGLYRSDSEVVQLVINCLSEYLKCKDYSRDKTD